MSQKTEASNQERDRSPSDDELLSRTDRFFIMSMLTEHHSPVALSEDTIIGGSTLSSIMERGRSELCDDLKIEGPSERMHAMYLLNLQKIAWDCFNEAQKSKDDLHVRDINFRYALKATDTFIQLSERLSRAKEKPFLLGERILVPLTANTLIEGATLRQVMEWGRIELYLDLKAQNPFEAILADLIIRTHRAGWNCYEQADWKRHKSDLREINLKYALKGTETSARLFAHLEGYRAKKIEAVLHKGATPGQKLGKVGDGIGAGRFAHKAKKQHTVRANLNGNGKHP